MDPSHKAGVGIAGGVGQDIVQESGVNLGQAGGCMGHGLVKAMAYLGRDGLPDGTLADVLDIVESVVEHLVSLGAE